MAAVHVELPEVPEALAAAGLEVFPMWEQQARMVLAVVAVAALMVLAPPAVTAEPAAWLFNMPTIAMWPPET